MKINRRTPYIMLPIIVLALLGAFFAGCACVPPGTMPPVCQQWYEKGKTEGYDSGYNRGKEEGKATGYSEGYTKGLDEGKKLCPECPKCPECPQYQYQYQYPYYYQYPYPYNYPYNYYGYGDYSTGYKDCKQKFCTQCPTCPLCP
jgi:hypothetical protein